MTGQLKWQINFDVDGNSDAQSGEKIILYSHQCKDALEKGHWASETFGLTWHTFSCLISPYS